MDKGLERLETLLAALGKEVRAAAIPNDCKHTAGWCMEQLPGLYAQFQQSGESRYGEQISWLFQAVLKGLVESKPVCPAALKLAASIPDRLRLLHDKFGIPALGLKSPAESSPRS